MRMDALEAVQVEMRRFALTVGAVMQRAHSENPRRDYSLEYRKETAACLRASLDLTRALAALRKP